MFLLLKIMSWLYHQQVEEEENPLVQISGTGLKEFSFQRYDNFKKEFQFRQQAC